MDEIIQRLESLIQLVKGLRAERWLREWPEGHSERPNPPPFVAEYLAQKGN